MRALSANRAPAEFPNVFSQPGPLCQVGTRTFLGHQLQVDSWGSRAGSEGNSGPLPGVERARWTPGVVDAVMHADSRSPSGVRA